MGGVDRGTGSLFGVACDFLDGRGHFVHGGGDLVGFQFLAVDPGTGLLGDRRQFFGGTGDLHHAIAQAADQFAQVQGHALHAQLQHAQFVAARDHGIVGQVTAGHAFGAAQGFHQRADDQAGDHPGGDNPQQQCGEDGATEQIAGIQDIVEALVDLVLRQLLGRREQVLDIAIELHLGAVGLGLGIAEQADGRAIVDHGLLQALHTVSFGGGQQGAEGLDIGDGLVDRVLGRLLQLGLEAVAVAAQLEARLLDHGLRFHQVVDLGLVADGRSGDLHELFQFGHGVVGVTAKHRASGIAGLDRLGEIVEVGAVALDRGDRRFEVGNADRRNKYRTAVGQVAVEAVQQFDHRRGAFGIRVEAVVEVTVAHVPGEIVELGDIEDPVAAFTQRLDTQPAGCRDQQGQHHDDPKAQGELGSDAYVLQHPVNGGKH